MEQLKRRDMRVVDKCGTTEEGRDVRVVDKCGTTEEGRDVRVVDKCGTAEGKGCEGCGQ